MHRQSLKSSLTSRIAKLEAKLNAAAKREDRLRMGYIVRQLPAEYTGECHLAVLRVVGQDGYGGEWCEVEERAGPAPAEVAERLPAVCSTEAQMQGCFGPEWKWPYTADGADNDRQAS